MDPRDPNRYPVGDHWAAAPLLILGLVCILVGLIFFVITDNESLRVVTGVCGVVSAVLCWGTAIFVNRFM